MHINFRNLAAVLACAACATPVLGQAESTFGSGLDGWTSTSGVTWESTGGNPGGYLRFFDSGPSTGGQIIAPAKFLGDLTPLNNVGSLNYDYRVFAGTPNFQTAAQLSGPGGIAVWNESLVTTGTTGWDALVAPLSQSNWNVVSGTWSALLADVTELRIFLPNASTAIETTGADNIRLVLTASAIPEPGTCALIAAGLLPLVGVVVRRHRA